MSGLPAILAHARGPGRVAWLRAHGADLPGAFGDVTAAERQALETSGVEMRRLGLYAASYEHRLVRWSIRQILSVLRGDPPLDYMHRAAQRYRS